MFDEGRKLYDLGHFEEAAERWEQAYLECDSPQLIFNLAQAQRRAGHARKAIDLYKRWRDLAPAATAEERADVEQKIADLEATLLAERQRASVAPPAREPTPPARDHQPLAPAAAAREPVPYRDVPSPPAWYEDGWGWGLAGTGTLVTSAGVVWLANAASDPNAPGPDNQANPATLGGAVSAMLGLSLLGAGVVKLLLVDGRSARDRSAQAPLPCLCARF